MFDVMTKDNSMLSEATDRTSIEGTFSSYFYPVSAYDYDYGYDFGVHCGGAQRGSNRWVLVCTNVQHQAPLAFAVSQDYERGALSWRMKRH